nr:MAG TPA: hypothetical protein [Caudoviricetes sp.]
MINFRARDSNSRGKISRIRMPVEILTPRF